MNQSLTNFDQASVDPAAESSTACYRQGIMLADLSRYSDALASFNQAIATQPDFHEAWVFRGVMLIHLERYEEALESCDRAIEIFPANAEAWAFRGVALHRLGRFKDAYASYNRAVGEEQESFWLKLVRRLRQTWKVVSLHLHV